ncbi:hypothetical protein B0T10DRAFT_415242 [Thelonectria olida]|uniref:Uncharacterized protein n=1 Tax=Thelonectria olida TaxID=1576542 RepID=A0A9P9AIN1_9HYPO|nr:hypothetical protein B0T10DRAFT_415242 [Thelonectria olida]
MISLRSYGRVIARSESPAYLLRWSEDGQTVHYGEVFRLSMAEFRLLGLHITRTITISTDATPLLSRYHFTPQREVGKSPLDSCSG